ncbi:Pvc16 family protein [Nannocystaceae bacterium ST9]
MLPESSLSIVATRLRSVLAQGIAALDESAVLIGTPRQANDAPKNGHHLNLFVHRLEPSGYPTSARADEPTYLRLHCLLTAFAVKETDQQGVTISAGENDLRLLGEVARVLHERTSLNVPDDEQPVAQVQLVPIAMPADQLNQFWLMQGSEVSYRASLAYELSLVPVPLARPVDRRPRVAGLSPAAMPGRRVEPVLPVLALMHEGQVGHALTLVLGDLPGQLAVQVAGPLGESIVLRWELLAAGSPQGWVPGPELPPIVIELDTIDPSGPTLTIDLPVQIAGQALLRAESVADPRRVSRPILVSVHAEGGE